MNMRITCKSATEYIVKKEEGKITIKQRVLLFIHLIECKLCKRFNIQNRLLNKVLVNKVEQNATLSSDQKEVIVQKMQEIDQNNEDS